MENVTKLLVFLLYTGIYNIEGSFILKCEDILIDDVHSYNTLGALEEEGEELGEEELSDLYPHNIGDEECPNEGPGYIKDCSSEEICCPSTWIGDGLCDNKTSIYGCDFSCIKEEFVDCVPPIEDSSVTSLRFSTSSRLCFAVFLLYTILSM